MKTLLRWILTSFLLVIGTLHFVAVDDFAHMVPAMLPWPKLLVYVSGVGEICGAIGLQIERTRRWAAWGLIALFIAVFPANVNMAIHHISPSRYHVEPWQLWARLPFQALFIAWAWTFTAVGRRENRRAG